jgi:ABC-type uncharacterized transport system substrate-binding protein
MIFAIKRLALGLILIVLAASILLISDWNQRRPRAKRLTRIAVLQHSSQAILDEGVRGMIAALAEGGFVDGQTISLTRYNAENDVATGNAIAKEITDGRYDLVLTSSTLSMQAVANANKAGKTQHVFGLVANPFVSGVGLNQANPLEHPKHFVGIGSFMPVADGFKLARQLFPGLKTVGVAWNPAEANSRAFTLKAREICQQLGITLLEANVDNSSGVFEAASSLVARGAQALWIGGDVTVLVAADSVINAAKKGRIPVFTLTPPTADRGALFDLGANFYEIGRQTGALAARILNGADPATIPITDFVPQKIMINKLALAGLKDPWQLPDDVFTRADVIIDETGKHEKAANAQPLAKKWKVSLIAFNNVVDVEEVEQGVLAGLRDSGLVEARDYETRMLNAQGDMATVSSLIDSAVTDRSDLIITLSTPTLQAAVQRARNTPVVFSYVANPVLAGAGRSDNDHLPNITGVYLFLSYERMVEILRECLPRARRIGTLFIPSEVNTVFHKDKLTEAATRAGIEVVAVPVSTSAEVADAALSLASQKIDAVVQLPGNLVAASFGAIAQAAHRAKLPLFAFTSAQAKAGAMVVLARDYFDNGKEAGLVAARVMRGENPAKIPFRSVSKTRMIVNLEAAWAVGFAIPEALVKRADEVIGK